jgi:hypothetical protein
MLKWQRKHGTAYLDIISHNRISHSFHITRDSREFFSSDRNISAIWPNKRTRCCLFHRGRELEEFFGLEQIISAIILSNLANLPNERALSSFPPEFHGQLF